VADLGHLTGEGKFITFARSNTVTTPRSGPSEIIDEEWMTVEFERIYALSGGYGIGKGSEEIKELMARRIKEEAMPPWVSSGWMVSPVGKKVEARKFWLQVGTELIVYGATEPDAKVSLQGQPVKLREDGTFSARFALPDGKQEVEVETCSSDGKEKKVIIPIVEKKTKSH